MLFLLALACTKGGVDDTSSDDTQTDDTASDSGDSSSEVVIEPLTCADPAVEGAPSSALYLLSIDEALFNDCENSQGKGLHIHVGEDTRVRFEADSLPALTAISDPGSDQAMTMTGLSEGADFQVEGQVILEIGTCHVGIDATLRGQMTGADTFCYQMDATAFVYEELSPDACELIQGETENHTFSELPCDQAWVGEGRVTAP